MQVKEVYQDHDQRTIGYMENLVDQLSKDFGEVPNSWRISLDMIADNLDTYYQIRDELKRSGMYSTDARGQTAKNPLLTVLNSVQNTILHLVANFGATPMSKGKIKAKGRTASDMMADLLS